MRRNLSTARRRVNETGDRPPFSIRREWGSGERKMVVCPRFRSRSSAQVELYIAEHVVLGARDLVFDERAAPGAEELAEHRPVVDVALVVSDVGVGRADVGFAAHAVFLVVL